MYKLLLSCKFGANFTFPPPRLFLGPRCNWLTLKWNSKLTKKGKLMACRILFSFSVCSTCFSLTTWEGQNRWLDGHRSSFRSLSLVDRRWMRGWWGKNSLSVCLISSWRSASCWPCAGLASPCRSCPSPMSSISQSHRAWPCSKMWRVYYGWTARHAKGIKRMLKQLTRVWKLFSERGTHTRKRTYVARTEVVRSSFSPVCVCVSCSRSQI